jgi:hypothetical protein
VGQAAVHTAKEHKFHLEVPRRQKCKLKDNIKINLSLMGVGSAQWIYDTILSFYEYGDATLGTINARHSRPISYQLL